MTDHRNFVATDSNQIIHEIAAPLISRDFTTNELHASGTATIIGQGYAVTATHVIEDHMQKFGQCLDPGGHNLSTFDILLYLSINEGKDVLTMKVLKVWADINTDIAVLWLAIPADGSAENHVWKVPSLQLLPPVVGEPISGFGFSNPTVKQISGEIPTIDLCARTTTGRVVEVHHDRRDNSRLIFPCFRTDAQFDGGMSGGPVFNSAGSLCGIICSSLPADEEYPDHITYVSTLWPMLGILIEHDPGAGQERVVHPLSDYFDGGHFFAVDRDKVIVQREPGEQPIVRARYAHKVD